MSNNKKNKAHNLSQKNIPQKDIFDVRENLKKLRSGSDNYSTKSELLLNENENKPHLSSEVSSNQITGYSSYGFDKVDVLRDRIAVDLSIITQKLDDHKEKTNERFSGDFSKLRNEIIDLGDKFDIKISSFITEKWFTAAVAVIVVIAGLIYTLSYSNVLSDIEDLKTKQDETEKNILKISTQIESNKQNKTIVDSISFKNPNIKKNKGH